MILLVLSILSFFFFFNDTATTEIYTLSLHDALPISAHAQGARVHLCATLFNSTGGTEVSAFLANPVARATARSEEHTSELQSRLHLVCRLLLEKKKKNTSQPAVPAYKPRGVVQRTRC